MATVSFTSTVLSNKGKSGILTPDSDGYYSAIVGGLNIHNSAGHFYSANEARGLFSNPSFTRRIQNGALKGEVGHPVREPQMSDSDYLDRFLTIREINTCAHYSEVWLDDNKLVDATGKPVVAIVAKVRPSGNRKDVLADSLENRKDNTAFSIRGFTEDRPGPSGLIRVLKSIITWDFVNEPGIAIAAKYENPTLESIYDKPIININQVFEEYTKKVVINGFSLESDKSKLEEISWMKNIGKPYKPPYSNW